MANLRVLMALVSLASVARAAEPTGRSAVDFVATHCGSCHSGTDPEGGLRLDTLRGDMSQERRRWADVRRVVIDKLMRPPDRRQPGSDEIDAIARWIDANSTAEAQRTPPRRLNRYEFNNAVHALLGIDEDLVRFLPEDAKAHGFDIDVEALAMPGPALEVYLRMASIAVGYAMQDTRPGVATTHITEPGPIRKILTHLGEPLEPPPVSPARGPPTDWGELVQIHDDRDVFQASPDEPPAIDIHSL